MSSEYDQAIVAACIAIYRAAESVATPTLFDGEKVAA